MCVGLEHKWTHIACYSATHSDISVDRFLVVRVALIPSMLNIHVPWAIFFTGAFWNHEVLLIIPGADNTSNMLLVILSQSVKNHRRYPTRDQSNIKRDLWISQKVMTKTIIYLHFTYTLFFINLLVGNLLLCNCSLSCLGVVAWPTAIVGSAELETMQPYPRIRPVIFLLLGLEKLC